MMTKDPYDQPRSKDWFWPWALGAGVVLIVGGARLYFLRGGEPPDRA